jgi:hypothetical protein
MIEEQPGEQAASGTGARLGEDRLQVVLDSLRRHAQPAICLVDRPCATSSVIRRSLSVKP